MITDEKNALDPTVNKFAKKLCRSSTFPMLIVDDLLRCVYSSQPKKVPVGTLLSLFIKEPLGFPLKKERDVLLFLNDIPYCARFIPIDNNYSFCHLLDCSAIIKLASCTNMYAMVEQRFSLLWECSDKIRDIIKKLEEALPPKTRLTHTQMMEINAEAGKLDLLLESLSNYAYMAFSQNGSDEIIDTHALIELLVRSTNKILAESGKYLDFITDVDAFFIFTNQRYAVIAILNAIQNALLYSPVEDTPVVSLTKTVKNDKSYVVVQVVNNIDSYTDINDDPDFACRRCGLGIPVIKKFVQRAGGEFYFKASGSIAKVGIMIPEYSPKEKDILVFDADGISFYDHGGRNIVETMMQDVISSVSRKKKRH